MHLKGGGSVKKKILLIVIVISLAILAGVAYAAFADKAEVLGTSVTVGSADIKMLSNLGGGVTADNLVDSKTGPSFENIHSGWTQDYLVKLFNNGTSNLTLTSHSDYLTANDPEDLRSILYVEPFDWADSNSNGVVDSGELGLSHARKTVVKWKTEGFSLGALPTGAVNGYILRFSADNISDSKQGASGVFDFSFDAAE